MSKVQPAAAERSWTADEPQGSSKWLPICLLFILLLVGLYVFAVKVWPDKLPSTYVTSFVVSEYNGQWLPNPAYPEWDLQAVTSVFAGKGLAAWKTLESQLPGSTNEFEESLKSLDKELQQREVSQLDTVVVYLRGHAIVQDDQVKLLLGEFVPSEVWNDSEEESGASRAVPMQVICEQLQKLPVGNVILLADICDLAAAPRLGVIANDVAAVMEQMVQGLDGKCPLWVITSAASLQPAHASYLRKRTLLQSACEYAGDAKRGAQGAKFLTLSQFYEAVARYSHDVTAGEQIPLLFHSGTKGKLLDEGPTQRAWQLAGQVSVAQIQLGDVSQEAPPAAGAPAQSPSAEKPPATTTAGTSDAAIDSAQPEAEESSPWLRFWQLRDRLAARTLNPSEWSPVDFAVSHWRQAELKAANLDRLYRLSGSSATSREMNDLVNQMQQLVDAMQGGPPRNATGNPLLAAWNDLQAAVARPNTGKLAWNSPEVLRREDRQKWEPIRRNYRQYMDATSQLPGWLWSGLQQKANEREILQRLDAFVSALSDVDGGFPRDETASALESGFEPRGLNELRTLVADFRGRIDSQASQLAEKLRNASDVGAVQIDWSEERAVQQLLMDTNLSFRVRRDLVQAFDGLSEEHLREPGADNYNVDLDVPLADVLSVPEYLQNHRQWCAAFQQSLQLATPARLGSPAGSTVQALNRWGEGLFSEAAHREPPTSGGLRWKQACMKEFGVFAADATFDASLIVTVSNSSELQVSIPEVFPLSNDPRSGKSLDCIVRRRNGDRVPSCYLKWELAENSGLASGVVEPISVGSRSNQKLVPNTTYPVDVSGATISLVITTQLNQSQASQGLRMRIAIGETEAAVASAVWHEVRVLLPNPDRIDLLAKCLNPDDGEAAWLFTEDASFGPVLKQLRVPAVYDKQKRAKSLYQLYLSNRSDKKKLVVASLYAVEGLGQRVGGGRITAVAAAGTLESLGKQKPAFVSGLMELEGMPPNSSAPAGALPGNLKQILFNVEPQQPPANVGEFGLLCLLQEYDADKPEEKKGPRVAKWIECVPQNPFGSVVSVEPQQTDGQFLFDFSMPLSDWSRLQLEELQLGIALTDDSGKKIESNFAGAPVLNPQQSRTSLKTGPRQRDPNQRTFDPITAHIDIGGYPRAVHFESRLQGNAAPRGENRAFVWLDVDQLACYADVGGQAVAVSMTQLDENTRVVKAWSSEPGQPAREITVSRISLPFRIDLPLGGQSATLSASTEGVSLDTQEFRYDRRFAPFFSVEAGNLVFSAQADDHVYVVPNRGFRGKVGLTVSIAGALARTTYLIFDRDPPSKDPRIQTDAPELFLDEFLEISMNAFDEDSAVSAVYFAINQGPLNGERFDDDDLLLGEARPDVSGGWSLSLEANVIEKQLPRGSRTYYLVCRAIDLAGNVRDDFDPLPFRWQAAKRPSNAPKVQAVKRPPPPPVAKEHTVIVQVTVDGKPPGRPDATQVAGIPGAEAKNNQGTWVFTKVPDGSYDVTATYLDAFKVEYVGTGKLTVSANSQKRLTIDAKRK